MANTTKKTDTEEVVELEASVESKPSAKKAPKKFAPNDRIVCRSVTGGELNLVGPKSQLLYQWADFGDETPVEYQDLQALQSRKSGFIVKPRFIIEDEDLVAQWSTMLRPIYDKVNNQTIDEFFDLPITKFKAQLKAMPTGLKDAIKTKAVQMIQAEELYDIRKVRAIDEELGTDFVEMFMK